MNLAKALCAFLSVCSSWVLSAPLLALDRPEITFQVFQFPADKIPTIDGDASDWALVPPAYVVGADQLTDAEGKNPVRDPKDLDVSVRVGWAKGLNRLYFLYEASDNYWDFSRSGLHNDTFEVIVDADASGGPLADPAHKEVWKPERVGKFRSLPDSRIPESQLHNAIHGVHAQNYHIMTPAVGKDWAFAWGAATWIKDPPYANSAMRYNFKPGESGKLVLECWITPFDHAAAEGPQRSVESILTENKIIGLGWIVIDYDDVNLNTKHGFWVLGRERVMYGDASLLPAFRLMPLEASLKKTIDAK